MIAPVQLQFDFPRDDEFYRTSTRRMQNKTARVLKLIDLLAPMRMPKSLEEIHRLFIDETGWNWCSRTIRRDIEVLEDLGMIEKTPQGFKLDLNRSERLQCAALALFPN